MILTRMLTNKGNFRYVRQLFSENVKMYKKTWSMSILYDSGEAGKGAKQEDAILPT